MVICCFILILKKIWQHLATSGNIWQHLATSGNIWQYLATSGNIWHMLSIEHMLSMPEGKTLEFKRDLSSLQPVLKTLIAFANTAGGTLIIGRGDQGEISGVHDVFALEERLANAIADSIHPPLMSEIEIASVQGKSLIIIRVAHWRGPFYLKAKGPVEGVFIRLGSTNRLAGEELLEELNRSRTKVFFDQLPCPEANIASLDMEKIHRVFAKVDKKIDQNKLVSLGILVPYLKKLVCSHGGLILFGQDAIRERYFPNTTVRCARFLGTDKVEFIDQYDVEGTILDAMDLVPKFIRRNTKLSAKIETIQRKDISEFSSLMVREILTNALVHADYSLKGLHPRIMIFSDRLEIESPGMLPFGYTLEDFKSGVSHVRNKVLARTFRELHMMEEWGTGYKRIADVSKEGYYPMPLWEELGTTLKVTLYPYCKSKKTSKSESKKTFSHLSLRQKDILSLFERQHRLTAKEIHTQLEHSISDRTLRMDLLKLKKDGCIKMKGSGPSAYWTRAE